MEARRSATRVRIHRWKLQHIAEERAHLFRFARVEHHMGAWIMVKPSDGITIALQSAWHESFVRLLTDRATLLPIPV